jgi:endonuclease/exonuclease/phosphatase family metal-dependent hydrolase
VHSPCEEKSDDVKGCFYEELGQISKYGMKILLGDFNAKVGREDIFKPTIGNKISHEIGNDNGVWVVNFATSTIFMFPHRCIHKHTWTFPHGKTHNRIDHVLIDRNIIQMYLMSDLSEGLIVILTTI